MKNVMNTSYYVGKTIDLQSLFYYL